MALLFAFYSIIEVGFLMAGILSSFVHLISGEPLRYAVERSPLPTAVCGMVAAGLRGLGDSDSRPAQPSR